MNTEIIWIRCSSMVINQNKSNSEFRIRVEITGSKPETSNIKNINTFSENKQECEGLISFFLLSVQAIISYSSGKFLLKYN